jgi:hypothetical protein
VDDTGQVSTADSVRQPADSNVVNLESAVASGGVYTPLDAKLITPVDHNLAHTATATSTGGPADERSQMPTDYIEEREEGEYSRPRAL